MKQPAKYMKAVVWPYLIALKNRLDRMLVRLNSIAIQREIIHTATEGQTEFDLKFPINTAKSGILLIVGGVIQTHSDFYFTDESGINMVFDPDNINPALPKAYGVRFDTPLQAGVKVVIKHLG
jgi:hypothetical protein